MNALWIGMVILSTVYGIINGSGDALLGAATNAAGEAVALTITLAAAYAFWGGLMNIAARIGAVRGLARILARPIARLFPGVTAEDEAGQAIATNLAANALGLGNAATPAGLRAASLIGESRAPGASDALLMFIIINCASVQLVPTTLISLRAAMGSAAPSSILLPLLIATAATTALGIALGLLARKRR